MTKPKGREPRRHRPSFGRIERILPATGSDEARLLEHVLRCEICTEAALSILTMGNRASRRKEPGYDSALASAAARARWLFERRMRGLAFAEELFAIPDPEARRRRTLELAQVEPWSVTVSLLEAADFLLDTDTNRALDLAKLAAEAAANMNPKDHSSADRTELFAQAHLLMGESLYRLKERAEEADEEARRQFAEATGIEPYPYSTRAIRRRRALEKSGAPR